MNPVFVVCILIAAGWVYCLIGCDGPNDRHPDFDAALTDEELRLIRKYREKQED